MCRLARIVLLSLSLLLGCLCASIAFPATKKPLLKPINLNSATSEQLQQVPGIGPATADKILQMRKSQGAFKSVDDLLAVRGIGRKRLDKMRKYLTVGKPAAAGKPGAATPGKSSSASNPVRAANCAGCAKTPASGAKGAASGAAKPPSKKAAGKAAPAEADDEPEEPDLR